MLRDQYTKMTSFRAARRYRRPRAPFSSSCYLQFPTCPSVSASIAPLVCHSRHVTSGGPWMCSLFLPAQVSTLELQCALSLVCAWLAALVESWVQGKLETCMLLDLVHVLRPMLPFAHPLSPQPCQNALHDVCSLVELHIYLHLGTHAGSRVCARWLLLSSRHRLTCALCCSAEGRSAGLVCLQGTQHSLRPLCQPCQRHLCVLCGIHDGAAADQGHLQAYTGQGVPVQGWLQDFTRLGPKAQTYWFTLGTVRFCMHTQSSK